MSYLFDRDFYLEVSKGNVPKHSRVNKSGMNLDIDTGSFPEDLCEKGGLWVAPTAARIHNIASSDANDTSAGTGARTIHIQGLDGSYALTSETITMNGTSNVATVNSYTIIFFMYIETAGSGLTNAGNIIATAQVDGTQTAQISIGNSSGNQTQMAIYQIPDGYKGYLNQWDAAMQQATASSFATVQLIIKPFGGVNRVRRFHYLNNFGNSHELDTFIPPMQLNAKDLIFIRVSEVTNNNTSIQGGFDLTLVQD
jgi:hypothetical protein